MQRRDRVASLVAERETSDSGEAAWRRVAAILTTTEQSHPVAARDDTQARTWAPWGLRRPMWQGALLACGVAAVAVVVPWDVNDDYAVTDIAEVTAFAPRGDTPAAGTAAAESSSARIGVLAYRVPSSSELDAAQPERLRRFFYSDDFLLFSYTNATSGSGAYRWLAILGKDASGETHWYRPSKPPKGTDTLRAVSIREASMNVDIPVAFRTPNIAAGPMRMYYIFSRREISRHDAEKVMALESGRHDDALDGAAAVVVEQYEVVHEAR